MLRRTVFGPHPAAAHGPRRRAGYGGGPATAGRQRGLRCLRYELGPSSWIRPRPSHLRCSPSSRSSTSQSSSYLGLEGSQKKVRGIQELSATANKSQTVNKLFVFLMISRPACAPCFTCVRESRRDWFQSQSSHITMNTSPPLPQLKALMHVTSCGPA